MFRPALVPALALALLPTAARAAPCPTATPDDCNSPTYVDTECGQDRQAMLDCRVPCNEAIGSLTFAQCVDASWRHSICGRLATGTCNSLYTSYTCVPDPSYCEDALTPEDTEEESCIDEELAAIADPTYLGYCESVVCPSVWNDGTPAQVHSTKCEAENWKASLCGHLEVVLSLSDDPITPPSQCKALGAIYGGSWSDSVPQKEVVYPEEIGTFDGPPHNGEPRYDPGHRMTVKFPDYTYPGMDAVGFNNSYYGHRRVVGTALTVGSGGGPFSNTRVIRRMLFSHQRAVWDSNDDQGPGSMIQSCSEYIYEKYYSYSRFEDATMNLGSDYRAVFNVAYDPDAGNPAALGTRGKAGVPQTQKNGEPNNPQITFPEDPQPRNVYFSVPIVTLEERLQATEDWENGTYWFQQSDAETRPSRPVNDNKMWIENDDLYAMLVAGQAHPITETWQYHYDVSHELSSWRNQGGMLLPPRYLDEELYAMEAKMMTFVDLVGKRERLVKRIAYLVSQKLAETEAQEIKPFGPGKYFDPGTVTQATELANHWAAKSRKSGTDTTSKYAPSSRYKISGGYLNTQSGAGISPSVVAAMRMTGGQVAQLFGNYPHLPLPDPLVTACRAYYEGDYTYYSLTCARAELAVVEKAMEAELELARQRGCLEWEEATPCDWNPQHFVQRMEDPYQGAREAEFQSCVKKILGAGGFDALHDPKPDFTVGTDDIAHDSQGAPCDAPDYRRSPQLVEKYMECKEDFARKALAAVTRIDGDGDIWDGNKIVVGDTTGDYQFLGNDAFNVTQDYATTWQFTGIPAPAPDTNWCTLQPAVHGHYTLSATVFGFENDLVNSQVDVAGGGGTGGPGDVPVLPSRAYLSVANKVLFDTSKDGLEYFGANEFNIIRAQDQEVKDLVNVGTTIVVVYIPVSLRAGITGGYGGAARFSADTTDCANGNIELEGVSGPSLFLSAWASASVDAVIVEAGIKVSLTIVLVQMPFQVDAWTKGTPQGGDAPLSVRFGMNADLDLVLSLLSGRVSAFVEVCCIFCESAEATLFSWGGLKEKLNLFHHEVSNIPLTPLVNVQAGGHP